MRTAIVIVSYQGEHWLAACLGSCLQHAVGVPVYVVENGSGDSSAELVAREFPAVKLLRQTVNLGFAAGNNLGIRAALADGAQAVFLLNQDAELTPGCLAKLEQCLADQPRVAAVQPAILLPNGMVNSLGNAFHYLGFGEAGGNGLSVEVVQQALPWLRNRGEPPYLSGAAVLLRAEALRQVGLFDDTLFMYHEDLELSLRCRLAGWHLAVEPVAYVVHHYEFSRSQAKYYYMERNRFVVWLSLFKPATLFIIGLLWCLSELPLLAVAFAGGWGKQKLQVYTYCLRPSTWAAIHARRQQLSKLRVVSDRTLLTYATPIIVFQDAPGGIALSLFNTVSRLVWYLVFPFIRW